MAMVGGQQVRDKAKERLTKLKTSGGPTGVSLSDSAKNIKIRTKYEDTIPEAMTPRKRK